jgi:CelD/BcsL family acetyltransferase involved in cellulose biosynthesis
MLVRRLDREAAATLWPALDARAGTLPTPVSWPWTDAWLAAYGDAVDHELVAVEDGGEPVGAALLTRRTLARGPMRIREVHLGTAGEARGEEVIVERNRLHAPGTDHDAVSRALVGYLRESPDWDVLVIDGFLPDDAAAVARAHGRMALDPQSSPYVDLAAIRASGGDALGAMGRGTRSRVRRSLRAFGELEVEWATDPAHALDVLDELVALHGERWLDAGQPGAFASPRFAAFHRSLVTRLRPGQDIVLFRVRTASGETVGCLLCYVEAPRVLYYQSGFARFRANAKRSGLVTHLLCLDACLERGFDAYDFLAGGARYKDELSTDTARLVWGEGAERHLRARAVLSAREARRTIRRRLSHGRRPVRTS